MFEWELGAKWFLLLLVLAPVVYWLASRPTSLLRYSSLSLIVGTRQSWRRRFARLPAVLLTLALVALAVAAARPRTPQQETRVSRRGIAIMMVVDLSSSMDARDMVENDRSLNRLSVVKDVFDDFVFGTNRTAGRGRPDDLIGLVTFARYADSVCPLTLDHGNLVNMVNQLEIVSDPREDGTALGDGLGLAVERLRRSKAKSRVAILLTDGVSNAGVVQPDRAAELAAENEIKVYCVGVGTQGMAPVPMTDPFGRTVLVARPVEIDESALKEIAKRTGGKYFRATDKDSLASIYRAIDALERTKVTEVRYLQYTEYFPYFVTAGLGLLGVAFVLQGSIFRRLP